MVVKMSIVLTEMICGFIVFSNLFHESKCAKGTKIIFPKQSWYTAASGSQVLAHCQSDSAVVWIKRDKDVDLETMEYDYDDDDDPLEEILELTDITYQSVGFYDCGRKLFDHLFTNSSFYLFVDDPVHLMVGPRVVRINGFKDQPVILPCRPTTPDVTVKLFTSQGTPIPFSLMRVNENKKVYFDPRRGFIFPPDQIPVLWHMYLCEFTKRGVRQEMKIDLLVNFGTRSFNNDSFVYLERQVGTEQNVTAKLGSEVQFVAEVFSNIRLHRMVTWTDNTGKVIKGSKKHSLLHTLENQTWETQLKIHNVTESDVGCYTVSYYDNRLSFELKIEDSKITMLHTKVVYLWTDSDVIATCVVNSSQKKEMKWTFRPHHCHEDKCEYKLERFIQFNLVENNQKKLAVMITLEPTDVGNLTCSIEDEDNHMISVTEPFIVSEIEDGFGFRINVRAQNFKRVATLTCVVSRFLYSNHVYWIGLDGFVIEKNYTVGFTNISLERSETMYSYKVALTFYNASKVVDGKYRCMAVDYNHLPTLKNYDLRIPPGLPPKVSESNMQNTTLTVIYMTEVNFTCRSEGFPETGVLWLVDDEYISDEYHEVLQLGPAKQSGLYKCNIYNKYGIEERYTQLQVIYELKAPVNLKLSLLDLAADQDVTLYCDTEGYANPNITWYKGNKLIEESPRITFSESDSNLTIHLATRDDADFYNCTATDITHEGATTEENLTVSSSLEKAGSLTRNNTVWHIVGFVAGIVILSAFVLLIVRIIRLRRSGAVLNYRNLISH